MHQANNHAKHVRREVVTHSFAAWNHTYLVQAGVASSSRPPNREQIGPATWGIGEGMFGGGGLFDQLDFVIWVRQHLVAPKWRCLKSVKLIKCNTSHKM